ncbi:alpha/beta hydrolase [Pelagibius sp. CAU 1746]|uniref:alpha/beta hydrolase n=1 Tax=Pelagibius sp. CAU 1746 TaxID=3140370 RepID=UPI00325AE5DF
MPQSDVPVDPPRSLTREDGTVLAYYRTAAGKARKGVAAPPGLIFFGGFMSDMSGTKALALEAYARREDRDFLRFDYRGHGQSSGRFEDATIGDWLGDALAVLDEASEGPQILIGSSMGGWIALLAARARPGRVAGLIGIAPAPDFTEDLIWGRATPEQRRVLQSAGHIDRPSEYSAAPYRITYRLIEEGRDHLLLNGPIPITCPVRLLHGMADADVPWQTSLRLAEALESADVEVTLVKAAAHRLSAPEDLARMERIIEELSAPRG